LDPQKIKAVKVGQLFPLQYDAPNCFCCGPENDKGIKLRFKKESETSISTTFKAPKEWTGWGKVLHGGFQALLLDEVTAWISSAILLKLNFVTSKLELKYIKPVYVDQELYIFGQLQEQRDKVVIASGEIRNQEGQVLTSAESHMMILDQERMKQLAGTE
jgi:acyl-coenzyme A thioesterase PaaI-like protein